MVLKQLGKGAAAAGVAGVLAATISLGQAAPAEAFLPALLAPVLIGGTGMTLSGVLGTTSLISGIGWGIAGAGVLGVGAYSTRDWWVPIVTGTFGGATPPPPAGEAGSGPNNTGSSITVATGSVNSYQIHDGWQSVPADPGAKLTGTGHGISATQRLNGFDATVSNNDPAYRNGQTWSVVYSIKCKRPDGTQYIENNFQSAPFGDGTYSGYPKVRTLSGFCQQSTHQALGIIAGPYMGKPQLVGKGPQYTYWGGPINVQLWGDTQIPVEDTSAFSPDDPELKYRSTVECVRPDGSLFEISAESTGSDAGGQAVKMPSCDVASPGSHSTMKQKVESLAPGETAWEERWGMTSPAPSAEQPLCDVRRPGPACQLALKIDGKPCTIGAWECVNWTSLARDPAWTERLSCQYGPYTLSVESCNPLERAYEEGGAPATEQNMDGNPDTRSDTMPNGQPQPKENTGTGGQTGTAIGTAPGGSPVPGGAATAAPSGSEGCFPGGWAVFNPMWIVDGIRCSFVPKVDIKTRVETLQATAETKVPLTWFSPNITGPGGGGCPNWVITMPGFSQNVICGQGFTNAILGVRAPLFGLLSAAMVWPLVRSLWYAAIPVMRVAPSSGGKD